MSSWLMGVISHELKFYPPPPTVPPRPVGAKVPGQVVGIGKAGRNRMLSFRRFGLIALESPLGSDTKNVENHILLCFGWMCKLVQGCQTWRSRFVLCFQKYCNFFCHFSGTFHWMCRDKKLKKLSILSDFIIYSIWSLFWFSFIHYLLFNLLIYLYTK